MSTENQFITAFNNGYTLAKYEPKLLDTVTKNLSPTNTYLEGLFEGKEQYAKEYTQDKLTDLDNLRGNTQEKDKDLGRDF
jgi:hypothetical protein